VRLRTAFLITSTLLTTSLLQAQVKDWTEVPKPALHKIAVQQPKRIELANGMVIFLQEDHELPLIDGSAVIRGGSREEPADKVGLVDVYGDVWRTGGTKSKTGDELDDYLETRAAKIETGGDVDSTSISFDSLKVTFDQVFPIFIELLREPGFREEKIALAKNQLNTGIARRNDDVDGIANREAAKLVFGTESPYAREATYTTVAAITRADLAAWHDRFVHPNNILIGIHGDFDAAQMEARLRKTLGSWPRGPQAPKPVFTASAPRPGVYFIPKDDVTQSEVRLVHLGVTKDNPDYYTIQVMNDLLSGGLSSRLVNNIRTKKGLAYDVGGGIGSSYDHPGLVTLAMGTKAGTTSEAIDALYGEIDSLQKSPIEEAEVGRARESILNSFIFKYDSKEKVLQQRLSLEFYGFPTDFLDRYRAGVEKVTPQDVSRVANKYIRRGDLALLVVGKAADFDKPLSKFGPVQTIDITTPELKAAETPKTQGATAQEPAANSPEATALFDKVVEGLGGLKNLMAVKSLREKANLSLQKPQAMEVSTDQTVVLPDMLRQTMSMAMGSMTMVVTPAASWMATPMGVRDMPASQRESALRDINESPWVIAQRASTSLLKLTVGGNETVGSTATKALQLEGTGIRPVRWSVDPVSGRILRSKMQVTDGIAGERVTDFDDFRPVAGVVFPFKQTVTINGETFATVQTQAIEVNMTIDPSEFVRPSK